MESETPSSSWSPRTMNFIRTLKEIVDDCTESEAYEALVDCNMNPNEAVVKLLRRDKFQIVESRSTRNKKMNEIRKSISQTGYGGSLDSGINPSCSNGLCSLSLSHSHSDLPSDTMPEMVDESPIKSLPDDQTATAVSGSDKDSKHSISDRPGLCESTNSYNVEAQERNHSDRNHSSDDVVVMMPPSIDDSEGHGSDSDPQKGQGSVVLPDHLIASAGCPILLFGSFRPKEFASITQLQSDQDASRTENISSSRPFETRNIELSADKSLESLYNARKEAMTPASQNVVSSSVGSHVRESNAMTSPSIDDSEGHGSDSDPRKGMGSVDFPEHLKASAGRPTLIFGSSTPGDIASRTQLQSDRNASRTENSSSSSSRNIGLFADESLESLYNAHTEAMTLATQNVVSSSVESHLSEYITPSHHESNVQNIGRAAAQLSFARTNPTLGNRSISNEPVYFEPQQLRNETSRFNSLSISDGRQPQLLANQPNPFILGNTMSPFQVERPAPPVALFESSMSSYPRPNLPFEQPSDYSMNNQTRPYTWRVQSGAELPSTFQQLQFHARRDNVLQSMPDLRSLPRYEGATIRVPRDFGAAGFVSDWEPDNVPGSSRYNPTPSMGSNSGYRNFLPFHPQNSSSLIRTNNGSSSSRRPPSAGVIGDNRVRQQNRQYAGYRQDQEPQLQYNNNGALGYSDLSQGSPPEVPQHVNHYGSSPEVPQDERCIVNRYRPPPGVPQVVFQSPPEVPQDERWTSSLYLSPPQVPQDGQQIVNSYRSQPRTPPEYEQRILDVGSWTVDPQDLSSQQIPRFW